ncbi:MAG: tRNA uridine-5-carboxymethylaminomethyl(34) synthesis GTPase MnmE [Candidatus Omnitrophota bacterium]
MDKLNLNDTIVAISTPIGEAGIGIVRLSGKNSLKIADKIFRPACKNNKSLKPSRFKSNTIHYGWIVDSLQKRNKKRRIIDEVLLTVMRAPSTYTREDIVEINCHSGIIPLKKILDLTLALGVRLAEPGEFTRRAFINGRIDLAQAESVIEIIRTKSENYYNACLDRLGGGFSREITNLSDKLLDFIAECEAQLDFPEEDTKKPLRELLYQIEQIKNSLSQCLKSTRQAKIMRDGISVAIAGRPNVGKSSLLNALINEDRSLVTPFAGTTRDTIEEQVCFDSVPLRLIDTAGLREAKHPIEREATRRSQNLIENAQLILLVFDASQPNNKEDNKFIDRFKREKNVVAVLNKTDLKLKIDQRIIKRSFGRYIKISALKRTGLDELKEAIVKHIWQGRLGQGNCQVILNVRQEKLIENALLKLTEAASSLKSWATLEIVVEDLKVALFSLNKISGRTCDIEEELLDSIFSQFCIGK